MNLPKLVRNKIPDIIKQEGNVPYTHQASGKELEGALWKKLEEEVREFQKSQSPEELADILEVVYAIGCYYGHAPEQIEELRRRKAVEKGSFSYQLILESIENQKK